MIHNSTRRSIRHLTYTLKLKNKQVILDNYKRYKILIKKIKKQTKKKRSPHFFHIYSSVNSFLNDNIR